MCVTTSTRGDICDICDIRGIYWYCKQCSSKDYATISAGGRQQRVLKSKTDLPRHHEQQKQRQWHRRQYHTDPYNYVILQGVREADFAYLWPPSNADQYVDAKNERQGHLHLHPSAVYNLNKIMGTSKK